ncbi:MAG: flagellar basal body P-ring protein FlgI [Pseudomonadota bacterium]
MYDRRREWTEITWRLVAIAALFVGLSVSILAGTAQAVSRIKDIADFEGIRDNPLIGYGLVVGLEGTGDSLRNSVFTEESLKAMLERLGVSTRGSRLNTKNVAAVMVTSNLPPFARHGSRVDVNVSALGDSKSLLGGTLLATPLLGADGEVYAVAQGSLAVSGFVVEGEGESVTRGVPTAARISAGAIVEREIPFQLDDIDAVRISLRNPDLTTASRIAEAVNDYLGDTNAQALDPTTVSLPIPSSHRGRIAGLLAQLEQLVVEPDTGARIVIDEHAGIIVMGANVRISEVAIAQGNLTVRISENTEVSQPNAFSDGVTTEVPRTTIEIDEQSDHKLAVLDAGVTLQDLVDGLNALGVGPRDMIAIIQAIKAAGALQAAIEVI